MTLPPHKLGDQGQRYEMRFTEHGVDAVQILGWSNDLAEAWRSIQAWVQRPGVASVWIYDRIELRNALP